MQRPRKLKASKKSGNEQQEIGVCGTGKQRVINVTPLPLTSSSASKIYCDGIRREEVSSKNDSSYDEINKSRPNNEAAPELLTSTMPRSHFSNPSATVKPFSRHERTIELSPSLMLPVTAMPSHNVQSLPTIDVTKGNISRTISTSSSVSDLQSSRQSMAEETDAVSSYSEQDSTVHSIQDAATLQGECERLREALRLADADIAILVSSKQQLQLELHTESDKARSLARIMLETEGKKRDEENKLRSSILEQEERNKAKFEALDTDYQQCKYQLKAITNSLDETTADRDLKKQEIESIKSKSHEIDINLEKKTNEVQNLAEKVRMLEALLRDATEKDEGLETFTKHLSQEREDISRLLQEKINESTMLQIKNKTLEAKIVDLQQSNQDLSEKSEKNESRFRETDQNNVKLTSRLRSITREKADLDTAVTKLRLDLVKVESSFVRLKKQMIDKTTCAEQETARRIELEEKVRLLTAQTTRLNSAEMRISDKNVQIEQLLTKSRSESTEKSKLEKEIARLRDHIDSNETSWVDAVQREKEMERFLKEKDDIIAAKDLELLKVGEALDKEQQNAKKSASIAQENENMMSKLKSSLSESESSIAKFKQDNADISAALEKLRTEYNREKVNFMERSKEDEDRFKNRIHQLSDEVDSLQRTLISKDEELISIKSNADSLPSGNKEQESINQLELLSELQSARRELSEERDSLIEEKNHLRALLEEKVREIKTLEDERENYQKETKIIREAMESEKSQHNGRIAEMESKLTDGEKGKSHLEEEMSIVKDHNNVLSQQLGALQIHNGKLMEDLKEKIEENEKMLTQQNNAHEELEILKQELASVTLQLTNSIQDNGRLEEVYLKEIEQVTRDRELLRSAVIRQQQYCVSLQKHYEEWAKSAADKMKEEVTLMQAQAKESRNVAHSPQNNRNGMSGWGNNWESSDLSNANEMASSPRLYSKSEEMLFKDKHKLDGDGDKLISFLSEGLNNEQTCSTCGRRSNSEVERTQRTDDIVETLNTELATLVEEKIALMQENTQQAETIAILQSRAQSFSLEDDSIVEDSSTQTSHDEVTLRNDFTSNLSPLLEDAATQTDHNEQPVGQNQQLDSRNLALEQRITELQNENKKLSTLSIEMKKSLQEKPQCTTISTQTDHDFQQLPSSVILAEDSFTQTDHNEQLLPDLSKEKYPTEWKLLTNENHILKEDLASALEQIQNKPQSTSNSTQTDHDSHQLPSFVTLAEDSFTQTDHNEQQLPDLSKEKYPTEWKLLTNENHILKEDLASALKRIQILQSQSNTMLEDIGTQTTHDGVPLAQMTQILERHEVSSTLLEDASVQTEHDERIVQSDNMELDSVKHELDLAQAKVELLTQRLQVEQSTNDELRNSNQDLSASKRSDDITRVPVFDEESSLNLPFSEHSSLPSPMTILRTMESSKLKAYKKTVHVLKKKLKIAEEKIEKLQVEIKITTENTKFLTPVNSEVVESSSKSESLEQEFVKLKKSSMLQLDDVKRKAFADKKIFESKILNLSERVSQLTETNKMLRSTVDKLQVKLTEKGRQGDIALKEKNRYQSRARRLQSSLRSLSWLAGNQEKSLLSDDFSFDENVCDLPYGSMTEGDSTLNNSEQEDTEKIFDSSARMSLPSSVVEIETSLRDLQSEIIALEKQMQEHNSAVKKSKHQWTKLKIQTSDMSSISQPPVLPEIDNDILGHNVTTV